MPSDYSLDRASKRSRLPIVLGGFAALTVLTVLFVLIFARPTTISTGTDEVGLHYNAGPFSSTTFASCVSESQREWNGPYDKHFKYPSSQTNFVFGPGGEFGYEQGIQFVTADGIEMTVFGVANFLLDTSCDTLAAFHDLIGNRYQAYLDDEGQRSTGWSTKVLPIYIGKPLQTAVDRAGQSYRYAELYNDPNVKAAWERDVIEALPELVNRQTDGDEDFFINFALTLEKPEPPQAIKDALVQQQSKVAEAKAREAEAQAQKAAAEAQIAVERANAAQIAALIRVLGIEGYLQRYAIDNGQNPFQPTTQGLITQ